MLWASVVWKPAIATGELSHGKSVSFRSDRARLLVLNGGKVQLYDVSDSQLPFISVNIPDLYTKAHCVSFVPNRGDSIAVGTREGVKIIRRPLEISGSRDWKITSFPKQQGLIDCLDFHPTGKYFIASGPKSSGFYLWDIATHDYRQITTGINRVTSLAYSPCGQYIALISDERWLMIYETFKYTKAMFATNSANETVVSFSWSMPQFGRSSLVVALSDSPYLILCDPCIRNNSLTLATVLLTTVSQYVRTLHQTRTVMCVKELCSDAYGCRLVVLLDHPHPNAGSIALFQTNLMDGFYFVGYIELAWSVELRSQRFYSSITYRYNARKKEVIFAVHVNGEVALINISLDNREKKNLVPSLRKELKSRLAMQSVQEGDNLMEDLRFADHKAIERVHKDIERSKLPHDVEQPRSKKDVEKDTHLADDESEQSLRIMAEVNSHLLHNVIIDAGSMMNVMKYETFKTLGIPQLNKSNLTLLVADGRSKNAIGYFDADVIVVGVKQVIPIHVIDAKTSYELILGKPWLRKVKGFSDWGKDEHFIKDKGGKIHPLIPYEASSNDGSEYDSDSSSGSGTTSDGDSKNVAIYYMVKTHPLSHQGLDEFDVNPSLSKNQQVEIKQLLQGYRDVFASNLDELKQTDLVEYVIETLPGEKPVCCKNLRRFSPEERQTCYEQLVKLEAAGFIQPDYGPYGVNTVFVKKKSNELRMCINYAPLNKKTQKV
eukprot:g6891.t1